MAGVVPKQAVSKGLTKQAALAPVAKRVLGKAEFICSGSSIKKKEGKESEAKALSWCGRCGRPHRAALCPQQWDGGNGGAGKNERPIHGPLCIIKTQQKASSSICTTAIRGGRDPPSRGCTLHLHFSSTGSF